MAQSCERLALQKSWSPLRASFDPDADHAASQHANAAWRGNTIESIVSYTHS
jgi:hypothetical protein